MIEAFPLTWPVGYPRTKHPASARFDTSLAQARDAIISEVRKFGGRSCIISSNVPTKRDGNPYATFAKVQDSGVAVYFTYEGEQVVFACDKWNRVEDNLQAIRKAIEAFRGLERWGVSELMKRAFTGFKALPEQTSTSNTWWSVLGVSEKATQDEIKTAFRNLSKVFHPDAGGDSTAFHKLTEAYQQGLKQAS